jgi:putative hydrolase of the HAD superfamily
MNIQKPTAIAQGLLLDVGVVFFRSAWEIADQYEEIRGLPVGTVVGRGPLESGTDERWDRYLQGEATEREYWLDFAAKAQANGAPLDGHPTIMRAMFQTAGVEILRPQALELVHDVKAQGLRLGILTNELMDFQGRDWVESQDWFPLFDVIIDSSEIEIRKPDYRAYQIAITAMGLPAHQIVFIDDNPTYVNGGIEAGLVSLHLEVTDPAPVFDIARRHLQLR